MKMTTKHCIYRNCKNKSTTCPNLTFFSFPLKDENKCRTWAELAGCSMHHLRNQYLCEEHFSPIYMSKTSRRTVLLPPAVPQPYILDDPAMCFEEKAANTIEYQVEGPSELIDSYDEEDPIYFEDIPIDGDEEIGKTKYRYVTVSSITAADKKEPAENIILRKVVKEVQEQQPTTTTSQSLRTFSAAKKRKQVEAVAESEISSEDSQLNVKYSEEDDDEHYIVDNISDVSQISSFVCMNVECVQMPKSLYLEQRAQLIAELKKYKNIVANIKNLVNTGDCS